jgi:branched-chain amino acid aminotransferase
VLAVSIDGVLTAPEDAKISIFDRGLLYGDGCFEVLRTWNGVARDLEAHLDRLYETARFLTLKAIDRTRLTEAIYKTIAAAQPAKRSELALAPRDHRVRILLTRGPGTLATPLGDLGPGQAIVIVEPLPPQPIELALAIVDWPVAKRHGEGHKTLAYLDHVYALELARAAGADEAVRLDHRGNVVEGATCNLFVVASGVVATPPTDVGTLPGIVRGRVLALCEHCDLASAVRPLSTRELRGADEIFVTSSLRGLVPITRLDGVPREAGPVTAQLARAYAAAMTDI